MDTLVLLEIAHRHFQDTLDTANLDRMTAHRDAEKRCHRLLRLSWKRSTVRVRRFWLLRLLALGFLGLRPFLCIRLGRRLGLREATAHTTQHSHEHLITPLLTSTPISAASMMRFIGFPPCTPPRILPKRCVCDRDRV